MKNRTKSRWKKIVLGIGLFLAVLVIGLTILYLKTIDNLVISL